MYNQTTIKSSFSLKGKSSKAEKEIELIFYSAPANFGYKIKRSDLPNKPIIRILDENTNIEVSDKGMTVTENNVSIESVDMVLHILYKNGIDNCLIEVSGEEFPDIINIKELIESGINRVGILEQYEEREEN